MKRFFAALFSTLILWNYCLAEGTVMHLRGNLDNYMEAVTVQKKATVAFVGGSITEMEGWKDMVKVNLARRFPDTEFTFIDACSKTEYRKAPHSLPDNKLEENCYEGGSLLSPALARKTKGFRMEEDWAPSDAGTRKQFVHVPTLVCEAGGSLTLEFEGKAIGLYCTCGPNAGKLSYTIDGKEYPVLDTYTRWSRNLYLPWLYVLANDLGEGRHTLKLKVLKGERQGCYIRNFAVNN